MVKWTKPYIALCSTTHCGLRGTPAITVPARQSQQDTRRNTFADAARPCAFDDNCRRCSEHAGKLPTLNPAEYAYAPVRALGGMNGGNAGTTGLDSRTERYSAPRQSQMSTTTPGRIATRQCKSSVKCVAEGAEVWRCPWWAVCISSIPS